MAIAEQMINNRTPYKASVEFGISQLRSGIREADKAIKTLKSQFGIDPEEVRKNPAYRSQVQPHLDVRRDLSGRLRLMRVEAREIEKLILGEHGWRLMRRRSGSN